MGDKKDDGPKKKEKIIIEGVETSEVPWSVLQRLVLDLLSKIMIERGERARAQREVDLIRTAWHNAEKDLDEAKAKHLRLMVARDTVLDEFVKPIDEMHQEMKWLNLSFDTDTERKSAELEVKLSGLRKAWDEDILTGMWGAKVDMKEETVRKQNQLLALFDSEEARFGVELGEYKNELDRNLEERLNDMEKRKGWTESEMKMYQMIDMTRVQEERNLLIKDLETKHKVVFDKTKHFFKETTESDVCLILKLFEEMTNVKNNVEWMQSEIIRMKDEINRKGKKVEMAVKALRQNENKVNSHSKEKHTLEMMKYLTKHRQKDVKEKVTRVSQVEAQLNSLWEEKNKYIEATQKVCQGQRSMKTGFDQLDFNKVFETELLHFEHSNKKIVDLTEKNPEFREQLAKILKLMQDEETLLKVLPLMITKEMKAQSDLLATIEQKMAQLALDPLDLMRIECGFLSHKEGPSGLVATYDRP